MERHIKQRPDNRVSPFDAVCVCVYLYYINLFIHKSEFIFFLGFEWVLLGQFFARPHLLVPLHYRWCAGVSNWGDGRGFISICHRDCIKLVSLLAIKMQIRRAPREIANVLAKMAIFPRTDSLPSRCFLANVRLFFRRGNSYTPGGGDLSADFKLT